MDKNVNLKKYMKFYPIPQIKTYFNPFKKFERGIHPDTWRRHKEIFQWAEEQANLQDDKETEDNYTTSDDPIVYEGYDLRQQTMTHFKSKYSGVSPFRILIHIPSSGFSPGGNSLFSNLAESIGFLGIPCEALRWDEPLSQKLSRFRPNILLTSDHPEYLNRINWEEIKKYRENHTLLIGLTAASETESPISLKDRLIWAEEKRVNFYYSFRNLEFVQKNSGIRPIIEAGYDIYSVEFGANILHYYPIPNPKKDLPYVFLASSNADKWRQYFLYLPKLVKKYPGFIDGPGWRIDNHIPFNPDRNRYLYSRGKIGINLHIDISLSSPSELNERTYILAACGIPQLVDDAKLLPKYFSRDSMFIAQNPNDFFEGFEFLINNPDIANQMALKAQKEVYLRHTTLHRADKLIEQITNL